MDKQLTYEVRTAMRPLRSVEEAAGLLGISKWTVRAYIRDGRLKAVRLGRRVLLSEEELERLVAECQGSPQTTPAVAACKAQEASW